MKNRVNQQGTLTMSKEFKIGWLIGAIEGEGMITVNQQSQTKSGKTYLVLKPTIRIDNTRQEFIDRAEKYSSDLGIPHWIRHLEPRKLGRKPVHSLFIYGMKRVHTALTLLLPYFHSKRELAELVYDFCEQRLAHPMTRQNNGRKYTAEELEIRDKIRVLNYRGNRDSSTAMSQAELIRL